MEISVFSHLFKFLAEDVDNGEVFVVDFIDLVFDVGGGGYYGFGVGAEHVVEFHHLRLDSVKR